MTSDPWISKTQTNSPKCGFTQVCGITNGLETYLGEYPWQVVIYQKIRNNPKETNFQHACGGSILNKNTILTAAHCFFDKWEMEIQVD